MNVAGHRLSTFEIESALVDDPKVAEAAVVSRPDDLKGEAIVAFVTLRSGFEGDGAMLQELREHVAKVIGPIAKPDNMTVLTVAPLLAETIMNVFADDSVSAIFGGENQLF